MNIDKLIEQWEEKHYLLLDEYSKGNTNNEVMQMYRSQMRNVLDFINELKQIKNNFILTECLHPYNAVRKNKKTELCTCSICEKEWY